MNGFFVGRFWSHPRQRKWLWQGGAALVLYAVAGFLLVPAVVKWQLLKQIPPVTHRQLAVRQVQFNPFALSMTVRGAALTETNGAPFASFEELYVNFQLSSLFRLAWTFDEIRLQEPRAEIVLARDGLFNFANMASGSNSPPPAKTGSNRVIPRVVVFNLAITNGHVGFTDHTRKSPFHTAYEPINLRLTHFTTRRDRHSPYSFEASSDAGRSIAWSGTVSVHPPASSGQLRIEGVQLAKHAPYIEEFTRAQLSEGALDLEGGYRFESGTNGLDLVVSNLAVTVSRLALKDPATGETVVMIPAYELRQGSLDLRARRAKIGSFLVKEPSVLVRRRADGTINLPSLILQRMTSTPAQTNAPATPGPEAPPWVFAIDDYRVEAGTVQLEDETVPGPFRTTLKPVTLRIERFSTAAGSEATLHAEATTEASETLKLEARYSINPMHATGNARMAELELKKYQPFMAPFFRGQIAAGRSELALEFSHRHVSSLDVIAVSNAMVRVTGLQINSRDGSETVVKVPGFTVEGVSASLPEKSVRVGMIHSEGASILARREADGMVNLLSLLATNKPAAGIAGTNAVSAAPPVAGEGWRVALEELALRDYAVRFEDRQLPKTGGLAVDRIALKLRGAQFPSNAPVQLEFSSRVNGAGVISARGSVRPYSPASDAEIEVAGLDLPGFQPWVNQHIKLDINSGALNAKARVRFAMTNGSKPTLHCQGSLAVTNLMTTDQVLFKEFVRWGELSVEGVDFDLMPLRARAERVRFAGLKTSVIIGPDKRPNFLAVLPSSSGTNVASAKAPEVAVPAAEPLPIELGELRLDNASIHFGDQSIQPPCAFDVQQFGGSIKGLSTRPDSVADVDVAGKVDDTSPFAIQGKVNPLSRELALQIVLTNRNLQLTPFTPYAEKYVGYPLNKGRLSLHLDYAVHNKTLKAQNKVQIDQLMLGARNNSPDAPKLPIKLAVALLRDSDGRIQLDLPVEGRLDDPQFSVAPIIVKVLLNLIVKAAASPFKLLGALVGGGEEMSYVDFAPGQAQFLETETNKLDKLIQALEKRPALNLEIDGSVHPAMDRDALALGLVKARVKAQRLKELSDIGQTPPAGEAFQVEPAEQERLLRASLVTTFGTNITEAVRVLAARATNATVAAERRSTRDPGLFKRVLSLFKSGEKRASTAQAHRNAKADALLLKQNPELAALTAEDMELLLAAKTEVPPEDLRQLMLARAKAVQNHLLSSGRITADRIFLVTPKTPDGAFAGDARVNLSLN